MESPFNTTAYKKSVEGALVTPVADGLQWYLIRTMDGTLAGVSALFAESYGAHNAECNTSGSATIFVLMD